MCLFWHICFRAPAHLSKSAVTWYLRQALLQSIRWLLAATGTWVYATPLARMAVGMGFAVSAKVDTKQKMKQSAILSSKLNKERELVEATQRAAKAQGGPRSINTGLKQKLDTPLVNVPRFQRHYVWSNSTNKNLSPAALYTEVAPHFPHHLLIFCMIQKFKQHCLLCEIISKLKLPSMLTNLSQC